MNLTKKMKYRKLSLFLCVLILGTVQINLPNGLINKKSGVVYAANNEDTVKEVLNKATTDTNKVWTIKFNSAVEFHSVKDRIQVNEVNNNILGSSVSVGIEQNDNMSIKITPPSGGYKKGQTYQITIRKGAQGKDGKFLTKDNIMRFSIQSENTVMARVEVSPVLDIFKAINITATTRNDIRKYKVEGNDHLFDIGEPSLNVINDKTSVQIYFYGIDGAKIIGRTTLNISNNSYDVPLNITSY
ncbi:hypothetical protein KQI86_15440 [Clostridium sp. MSJ-11]|uniref:SbsA Ig-like domain-containing protein n=1 Tax=Clostridium mobile TaxID=2841512 RepID=A0ABS6EKY0_9CLOT|nr:hypothetical protein [Clostridium mobile]MBU5485713.1 hypothetical protein [Clostridium mobile]